MTDTTDPRPLHRRAIAQTESIVAAVSPGQLDLPTPCPEYDVRALLSHIVGGLNRVAIVGEGGGALARPARADGVPDDGWLAAYRTAAARAIAAWAVISASSRSPASCITIVTPCSASGRPPGVPSNDQAAEPVSGSPGLRRR